MKVMQRGIMKILPGKMAQAMELNERYMAILKRYEVPSMRMYRPFIGGGDYMHTVIFEVEWESLEKMATFFEKVMEDSEVQEMMPQWEELMDSHEVELYWFMS